MRLIQFFSSLKAKETPLGDFKELLERRGIKTAKMFHGTSDVFLPQILKHGLLMKPPQRTYDSSSLPDDYDFEDGDFGYDMMVGLDTTAGGVYLSPNRMYAMNIADEAVMKFGGKPMIVTMQYTLGSGNIDEDEIFRLLVNLLSEELRTLLAWDDNFLETGTNREGKYLAIAQNNVEIRNKLLNLIVKTIPKWMRLEIGMPNETALNSLRYVVGAIIDNAPPQIINNRNFRIPIIVSRLKDNAPDYEKHLLIAMSNIKRNSYTNVVAPRNIGFRGRTRIIKIEVEGEPPAYVDANYSDIKPQARFIGSEI